MHMNKRFDGNCSCVLMNTTFTLKSLSYFAFMLDAFIGKGALLSSFELFSLSFFATVFLLRDAAIRRKKRILVNVIAGCS